MDLRRLLRHFHRGRLSRLPEVGHGPALGFRLHVLRLVSRPQPLRLASLQRPHRHALLLRQSQFYFG